MKLLSTLRRRFAAFLQREKLDAELNEELRFHLDRQTEVNVQACMSPEEARYAALRQFGWVDNIKQTVREQHGFMWLDQLRQDIQFGIRMLAKNPGFTAIAVLTLALGIGSTSAIFTVVHDVLLDPLPGGDSDRLVQMWDVDLARGGNWGGLHPLEIRELRALRDPMIAQLTIRELVPLEVEGEAFTETLYGYKVTPNFFGIFNVHPYLGRAFGEADGKPGQGTMIILSYGTWKRRFGGNQSLLGKTIRLGKQTFTLVGVMPPHFQFPYGRTAFWIAQDFSDLSPSPERDWGRYEVVGRLREGVLLNQMHTVLRTISTRLKEQYPDHFAHHTIRMERFTKMDIPERLEQTLGSLAVVLSAVLAICCTNIVGLLLARTESRSHEMAIRTALGAGRVRLLRQFLTESLVLASLGGLAGLFVCHWSIELLYQLIPIWLPRLRPVGINTGAFAFASVVTLASGIGVGIVPAWRVARVALNTRLKERANTTAGRSLRAYLQSALVVGQLSLTLALLSSAGWMLQSIHKLLSVNLGYDPEHLVRVSVRLPEPKYAKTALCDSFVELIRQRFEALPGVAQVGIMFGQTLQGDYVANQGDRPQSLEAVECGLGKSSPLKAIRAQWIAGRDFAQSDGGELQNVIVNEALAKRFWPSANAIGQTFRRAGWPSEIPSFRVIGVVKHLNWEGYAEEQRPRFYLAQGKLDRHVVFSVFVRTHLPPHSVVEPMRNVLKALEPSMVVPVLDIMTDRLYDSTATERTYMLSLGLAAGLGLVLSALGLYGVVAYAAARRTREIGVRIAFGATTRDVILLCLRHGAWLIAAGILLGMVTSFWARELLRSQLFGFETGDRTAFGVASVVLGCAAMAACYLPARRAAKGNPIMALRHE